MSKQIRCPNCGEVGNAHDDHVFELRGKYQGKYVRKCRKCDAGMFVPLFFGKAKVIPIDLWKRMQETWDRDVVSRFPNINDPRPSTKGMKRISKEALAESRARVNAAADVLRTLIEHEPLGTPLNLEIMPTPKSGSDFYPDVDATPITIRAKVEIVSSIYGEQRGIVIQGHEPDTPEEWNQIGGLVTLKAGKTIGDIVKAQKVIDD